LMRARANGELGIWGAAGRAVGSECAMVRNSPISLGLKGGLRSGLTLRFFGAEKAPRPRMTECRAGGRLRDWATMALEGLTGGSKTKIREK
jgi:hypothetical protein